MDKYEKIRKIGRGTFGDVILVRRIEDGELLALKKVMLDSSSNSD
jgi:serine/threonine protein kinase